MKIIVTGSSGFIGMNLCQCLLNSGHHVSGIDNFNNYYDVNLKRNRHKLLAKNKYYIHYEKDINEISEINLKKEKYDLLINLAAQPGVRLSTNKIYKYVHSNILGFESILNFCKSHEISNLIYASSSSVYSGNVKTPFSELDKLQSPTSFYAYSKIYNEQQAKIAEKEFGLKSYGLRFFTVYGEWGRPDMAYFNFLNKILNNEEITIFNNGEMYRDMTYISDICDGVLSLIENIMTKRIIQSDIFNLGNDMPISVLNLVKKLEKLTKKKAHVKNFIKKNEVKVTHADIDKAGKLLNYVPKTGIDEGLGRFFNWYKSYYGL